MPARPRRDRRRRRVRRRVNGLVAGVLGSRAHPLLSRWLLLLTYRGRRTGRTYTIPLLYAVDGDDLLLVALHPERQQWWRNVGGGADVELRVRGAGRRARATPSPDAARSRAVYAARRPWAGPVLRRARRVVFVRVTPLVEPVPQAAAPRAAP